MSNLKNKSTVKIMLFGTFDGVHKGHLNFFKQAKKISTNSQVVVSVARDKNVLKIKKGLPFWNEKQRKKLVEECEIVDKVVLGGINDHIPHIKKEKPNIIALGYDQKEYVKNLKKDLENNGIFAKIIRLKPYKEKVYKNSLLRKRA